MIPNEDKVLIYNGLELINEDSNTLDLSFSETKKRSYLDTCSHIKESNFLIKTNLIFDAILQPSIELEFRLAPHWSILADYSIAWWSKKSTHQYYQFMQLSPELRYWFSASKPWHGHYLGLFAGAGLYDLENGFDGYKGEFLMSGLTYGYMFPIGKKLSLDAGIGVGYLSTIYEEYIPIDTHYVYQQTSRLQYIGPLKVRLALTWHIGSKHTKN